LFRNAQEIERIISEQQYPTPQGAIGLNFLVFGC
jgi:hypothetical protein